MLFNSLEFMIFFPVVCLVYYVIPHRVRYIFLLACSYFFYMCWNPTYALLMLTSTAITYVSGLLLSSAEKISDEGVRSRRKKWYVALSFASNLSILFFFKYFNFAADTVARLLQAVHIQAQAPTFDVILPVGISFYTFQALSYTVDVYRNDIYAEKNFLKYALFVSFFPQLVAGPIERSKNLLLQINEKHRFEFERVREGLLLMLYGYFQKVVLAEYLGTAVDAVYNTYTERTGFQLLLATILFAFQIYCDFGGYSYIAIGSAKVLGFRLMDNFKAPYLAVSVHDFWRRWHISLTSWFTDYLYIPLGGNRKGKLRKYLNVMIVFLVSGLWHGADWTYVIWGGINGLYMVIEEVTGYRKKAVRLAEKSLSYRIFAGILTFALVDFSWLFFRASSLDDVVGMLRQIKAVPGFHRLFGAVFAGMEPSLLLAVTLALLLMWQVDRLLYREKNAAMLVLSQGWFARYLVYGGLLLFILLFGVYGYEYAQTAFIYFQF